MLKRKRTIYCQGMSALALGAFWGVFINAGPSHLWALLPIENLRAISESC